LWGEGATTLKVSNDALHRCEQYCVSCDAEHTWNVYGQPRTSVTEQNVEDCAVGLPSKSK